MALLIMFLPRRQLIINSPKHNTDGKTEDIRRRIVLRDADWFSTGHDDWWGWRVAVECNWSALQHCTSSLLVILVSIHHFWKVPKKMWVPNSLFLCFPWRWFLKLFNIPCHQSVRTWRLFQLGAEVVLNPMRHCKSTMISRIHYSQKRVSDI